jgi:nucleoside 2-deoxyribosyltransferase
MKIYFGFTVAGDRSSITTARVIVGMLEAIGHVVLTKHLVEDDAWEKDRLITAQQVYQRDLRWLTECDCLMAEVSGSSFGLGFETGYLLGATDKDAVLFYRRDVEKRISLLITGNAHPRCTLVPYSDVKEIEAFIASRMALAAVQKANS